MSSFNARAKELSRESGHDGDDSERRIRECERRVANLTESLAKIGWSDALAARLRDEEAELGRKAAAWGRLAEPNCSPLRRYLVTAIDFRNSLKLYRKKPRPIAPTIANSCQIALRPPPR